MIFVKKQIYKSETISSLREKEAIKDTSFVLQIMQEGTISPIIYKLQSLNGCRTELKPLHKITQKLSLLKEKKRQRIGKFGLMPWKYNHRIRE